MGKDQYLQKQAALHTLNDEAVAYENLEIRRRKESILLSDTEIFKMFTKLMRIG